MHFLHRGDFFIICQMLSALHTYLIMCLVKYVKTNVAIKKISHLSEAAYCA